MRPTSPVSLSFPDVVCALAALLTLAAIPAWPQQPIASKPIGQLVTADEFRSAHERTLADAPAVGAPRIPAYVTLRHSEAEARRSPLRSMQREPVAHAQGGSYRFADLNALSYPDLVALLVTSPQITDSWQFNADSKAFYLDSARVQYLLDALQARGATYTANNDQGIPPLAEIIRAGFYLAFYYPDIGSLRGASYLGKCLPAIHAVQANPDFGLGTSIQNNVVKEMGLLANDATIDPQGINGFAPVIQAFNDHWATYAGDYSKGNAVYYAMNGVDYVLTAVLQGQPYTPQLAGAYAGTIDAYVNEVARLATSFDYDPGGTAWIIDNAVYYAGYDGRFSSTPNLGLAASTAAVLKYGRNPWVYASAQGAETIHYLYQDTDSNGQVENWAQVQTQIQAQYTPVSADFDCGLFHTHAGAQVDPVKVEKLIWAHKETRAQFFRALASDVPVDPNSHVDDTLTLYLYDSPDAYRMNRFAWGLATDNGGMYIESMGTFFSYERTPAESYYTLEELFRHEGVHYLQGRYEEPGAFGSSPLYDNNRVTWIDEGSAEFFAGSTRTEGVLPRLIEAQLVEGDGQSAWYTIPDVINAGYGDFVFYHYADAFVGYLYHYHWDSYLSMLARLMANDSDGFSAIAAQDAADPAMNAGYRDFLQYLSDNASTFLTPSTSFDYLSTPPAKPPSEVYAEIQAATGLSDASATTTTGCTDWDTYTLRGTYAAGPTKGSYLADWQDMDSRANGWLTALANGSWSGYATDTAYFTNYRQDNSGQTTWQVVFHGVLNDGSRTASPRIAGFTPLRGAPGTSVVLTGTGFSGATAVLFNGHPAASFRVDSDAQITAVAPAGLGSGPLAVTTPAGSAYSTANFAILGISSFAPPQSGYRNGVTLTGAGFTGATDVRFNGASAPVFTVNSDTSVWASVPIGATTGPLVVVTPDVILTSTTDFVIVGTRSFSPAHGYPGTIVTLTGKGFSSATGVLFGTVAPPSFSVDSDTQITTSVPVGVSAGSAELDVTTPTITYFPLSNFTCDHLAGLAFNPASLTGGGSTTGTITLSVPAQAGGAVIALASDNAAVQVPASVTIPAGSSQAQFQVSTSLVSSRVTATVTAPLDGTHAQLVLDPQAVLNVTVGNIPATATRIVAIADGAAVSSPIYAVQAVTPSAGSALLSMSLPAGTYRVRAVADAAAGNIVATGQTSVTVPATGTRSASIAVSAPLVTLSSSTPASAQAGASVTLGFNVADPGDVLESASAYLYTGSSSFNPLTGGSLLGVHPLTKVSAGQYTVAFSDTAPSTAGTLYFELRVQVATGVTPSYLDSPDPAGGSGLPWNMAIFLPGSQACTPVAAFRDTNGAIRLISYGSTSVQFVGGLLAGDPVIAQSANCMVYIAARDNYNFVWLAIVDPVARTATWKPAGSLVIQGQPAIAVGRNGIVYIGVRDTTSSFRLIGYTPGVGFSSWLFIGGLLASDPAMAASPDGSVYMLGRDTYGAVWSAWYVPGNGFQGWKFLPGGIQGVPSVSVGTDAYAYIAVRDSYGYLYEGRLQGKNWMGWVFASGVMSADPKIAAAGDGTIWVAMVDQWKSVWYRGRTEGASGSWGAWTWARYTIQSLAAAATPGQLYIVGRDSANALWWYRSSTNLWSAAGGNGLTTGGLSASPR